jgi:CHAD domain-containing protein
MAYRLEAHESVSTGTRRVLLERVTDALNDLTNPAKDRNKGVHDARKNFKRLRAALRLIRGEIGEKAYQQENVQFRDAARLIASARDSWVMVEALDKLVAEYQEYLAPNAFAGVRQTLVTQYELVKEQALEGEDTIPAVVETLQAARTRLKKLPIQHENFTVFREGLQKIYAQGQKAMQLAYTHPSPEMFHEWRKRVKYLWYPIEILTLLRPNVLANLAEELHTLSEYLGDDHDLAVLRRTVLDAPDGFSDEKELRLFITLIDQKRLSLQAVAQPLGERLYFDPPKIFTERIHQYWRAWRAEDETRQEKIIRKIQKASPPPSTPSKGC